MASAAAPVPAILPSCIAVSACYFSLVDFSFAYYLKLIMVILLSVKRYAIRSYFLLMSWLPVNVKLSHSRVV